jgi:two-component system, NtrC family, response regulator AlgB
MYIRGCDARVGRCLWAESIDSNIMSDRRIVSGALGVLVVDDEEPIRVMLSECLHSDGHAVTVAASAPEALAAAARHAFDLVFLDLRLGESSGLDLIPRLLAESPWATVIVVTAYATIDTAVEAIKRGASDYLAKPVSLELLRAITHQCAKRREAERRLESAQDHPSDDPDRVIPAASSAMRRVLELAKRVAPSNASLLITGEVGVGKTRLAHFIHRRSGRSPEAFGVACCQNAAPEDLEIELFGAAGQSGECQGRIACCQGGTLVLCEIGELPIVLQPRLLHLLGDKEYERQNDFRPQKADVRVIATSSTDLHQAVERGAFRAELLLAVDVVDLEIPPLRSRPDDIRLLADRYLAYFAQQHGRPISAIDPAATDALLQHGFPGNDRELRNLLERAVLLCPGDTLLREHFSLTHTNGNGCSVGDLVPLETVTDQHIRRVLASTHSLEAAAAVLGINPSTLWRRRKRYGF